MTTRFLILIIAIATSNHSHAQDTMEPETMTPEQVLVDLLDGNKRHAQGKVSPPDLAESMSPTTKSQHPQAIILSCQECKVSPETVFDQASGDIYACKVPGNVANEEQLGSIEFANKLANCKLFMVLGQTSCSVIKSACDHAKLGNLTGLEQKIGPAIESVEGHEIDGRDSENLGFVNAVVEQNVRQAVSDIRTNHPLLDQLEKKGQIMIVGAVYNIHSKKVTILH